MSSSTFPIPSLQHSEPRFEHPRFSESPEDYEHGGYCPVRLHQRFRERYRVLRKLGWGMYATVWLARDDNTGEYVALKIGVADGSRMQHEMDALQRLGTPTSFQGTAKFTQRASASFDYGSINGTHQVIVLEPLGQTLSHHLEVQSRDEQPRMPFAREVCKQIVQAVNHVHASHLVHRDLQPGNILFALQTDLRVFSEDQLQQLESNNGDVTPTLRLDRGRLDATTPPYLVEPRPLDDEVSLETPCHNLRAVLSDFGAVSSFQDVNDGFHAYPVSLRPPELVLGIPMIAPQADIWSLGCVIFEVVCFHKLFYVDTWKESSEDHDNDLLRSITEVLGPLPAYFLNKWKGCSRFVHADGTLLPNVVDEGIAEPLEELVKEYKPIDMDDQEMVEFTDFLKSMLQVEPEQRLLTNDLLSHKWLQRCI